ncbi:MAG: [Fe-Fe] hydrogenase large subunit C-terminal domain-containing protein, partial [Desulfuromonadales bacterium]
MPPSGPITTIRENCRKCYACVRNCPVKAIRVCRDHAEVIDERCIGCGKCVLGCSQKARVMADGIGECRQLLGGAIKPVAVLGCSYPAYFHDFRSGQLVNGLKHLGFAEVHEGTAGVDLLHASYRQAIESGNRQPLINSHCPAVVALIERHYPQLLKNLAGIVSPMVAIGRFIKQRSGPETPVVYVSACFSGKFEIATEGIAGAIDCVLTYRELSGMLRTAGIDPRRLAETPFDGRRPESGRLFAIPGGPFRAFGIRDNLLDPEYLATDGEQNVLEVIHDLAAGHIT